MLFYVRSGSVGVNHLTIGVDLSRLTPDFVMLNTFNIMMSLFKKIKIYRF